MFNLVYCLDRLSIRISERRYLKFLKISENLKLKDMYDIAELICNIADDFEKINSSNVESCKKVFKNS